MEERDVVECCNFPSFPGYYNINKSLRTRLWAHCFIFVEFRKNERNEIK